ncbi:MAK10-like protein [Tanacetum coccineum]
MRLFQFSLRDQASNWLERLPAGSITIWEDLTNRFLAQFFPLGRTLKLRNDILINAEESWALLEDLALYDNECWNDPRDFAKPVKAISLPQDVPSTSDRRLIELENQVQCLMGAHLAPMHPTQVNKITSSCEICSSPRDTQTAWKIPNTPLLNIHPRVPTKREAKEEERERKGDPKNTNTIAYNEEQRDMPQLERKDITDVDNLGPNRDDDGIEWLDVKEPLDLVDISEESVYESLIKEMPKCSHNYDFKIKKVDPRNLKIPCMIDRIKEITFKTPYKDPNRSELSSDGHDLLPSRVILSEDDYDRGCRKPSDLEDGFYRDIIKLGPEYVTGMDDEGEVT